jgi:DNA-binding IclR family transcriptional regulator
LNGVELVLDKSSNHSGKDDAPGGENDGGPHGLLERTLGVLELLSLHARGLQLSEIAEKLHMPRSATHRVLTGLAEHNYVRQDRHGGAYQLTARLASLAFTFLAGSGVTDFAQPILDRLARETGELVRLATVDGRELVWVAKSQGSTFGLRYDPDMGQVARLSCSASGHAWLSCLPEEEAIELIEKQGYGKRRDYGPRAPESRTAVIKALRQARKLGYAITEQTYTPWMNSIATPVHQQHSGEVIGTIVITGPHVRLTEARMQEIAPLLQEAAHEMAMALAASPQYKPHSGRTNIFNGAE